MRSRPDILAALYRQSMPRLAAFACILTGNDARAAELVQSATVRAFTRSRRPGTLEQAEARVLAMMRTLYIEARRRSAAHRSAAQGPEPVTAALAALTPQERVVLAMYYWEQATLVEISQALNLSDDAVRRSLDRGREVLAPLLGEDDEPERTQTLDVRP